MESFYMIIRETGGSAPSRRHKNLEEAKQEAERLVQQTGESYFILKTIGVIKLAFMPIEYESLE